jgi:RNA polymerase sigma factor (sigma-70 family)
VEDDRHNPLDNFTEHSPQWWGAVYEMHAEAAYRGALEVYRTFRITYDASEVEDVVQEVFKRLMETRAITNRTDNIGAYVRRCARNEALDRAKRQKKIASPTTTQVRPEEDEDVGIDDEGFEEVDDADEYHRQAETARANVSHLTDQERRVARMLRQGLKRREIAFNEGVSKTRVTAIKNNIKRKLRAGYGLREDGTRMMDHE